MKEITVFINGTPKTVEKNKEYTFEEVVVLAFGSYDDAAKDYTMTSTNKNGKETMYLSFKRLGRMDVCSHC